MLRITDRFCPFHKGCLEGRAAGQKLEARTGVRGEHIDITGGIHGMFGANYIAQAAIQATLTFRPENRIRWRINGSKSYGGTRSSHV